MRPTVIRSALAACLVGVPTLLADVAQGGVVLSPNDVQIDFWHPSVEDVDLVHVAVESAPVVSVLAPVPGFTGVSVSETKVTWTFLENYDSPDGFVLTMNVFGAASGLVTTDRVLVEWNEVYGSGPGLWGYGIYSNLRYADETLDEGFGGDANGNPDGALWLHTLIGKQNGLAAAKYTLRVDLFFLDAVTAGDQFTLEIRGNSIEAGTASVIPEPGVLALFALGLMIVAGTRRGRRQTAADGQSCA